MIHSSSCWFRDTQVAFSFVRHNRYEAIEAEKGMSFTWDDPF